MVNPIFSDGREYISAIRAAKKIGYASDYIGQLCRDKKIPATLVGKSWYVDFASLLEYKKSRHNASRRKPVDEERTLVPLPETIVYKDEVAVPRSINKVAITYEIDDRPWLPELSKKSKYFKPAPNRFFVKEAVALSLVLVLLTSVGLATLERVLPRFDYSIAEISLNTSLPQQLASVSSGIGIFFTNIKDNLDSLKTIALNKFFFKQTPKVLVTKSPPPIETPLQPPNQKAVTVTTPALNLSRLKSDLKTELESYIRLQIDSLKSPVAVYSSSPSLVLKDVEPSIYYHITNQSSADTERTSTNLSHITDGGIFTNASISNSSFSGSLVNATALSFSYATGTSATTTNLFSTNASTTNLWLALGACDSLDTDSAGNVICGTDATGGGGNVATSSSETSGRIPFWTSTAATPATLSGGVSGFTFDSSLTKLTVTNASTTNFTSTDATTTTLSVTTASTTNLIVSNSPSALLLTSAGGVVSSYAGVICTSQFVRALSALGVATCETVGATDVSLANLSATDSTLTFSGTYNGSTARTIGINLANTNTWTGAQIFDSITRSTSTNATTTNFFATTASSTNLYTTNFFGASLSTCQSNNVLTWNAGAFGCEADDNTFSFTATSYGVSTSTTLGLTQGFLSTASSTIDANLLVTGNSTSTNATTTNFFSTTASSTNLYGASINGFGLSTCTGTNKLTWTGGNFVCATDSTASSTLLGDANTWSGTNIFNNISRSTSTNATSTNLFSSLISANTLSVGGIASTTINSSGDLLVSGSSTLQNFTALNSTSTSATTTNLFSTVASSTNLYTTNFFGASLSTCQSNNVLTWNAGSFGCEADDNTFSFTATSYGVSTSTTLGLTQGFLSTASSTIDANLLVTRNLGIGTTTPAWALQVSSSTASQLTLSDPSVLTNNHWSFRNAGGLLYLATSSASTFATSTVSALSINANGKLTLPSYAGTGCAQFDTTGLLSNTGSACGSGGGASDTFWATTTSPYLSIYPNGGTNVNLGIGTTTGVFTLTAASSSGPQLALSSGAGFAQWAFRNAGGNLYFATTTVAGTATTSTSALTIIGSSGNVGVGTTSPWSLFSINPNGISGPSFVIGSSTRTDFIVTNGGLVGIGTTSPYAKLSVVGEIVGQMFTATSTSATSTFAGGLDVGSGAFTYDIGANMTNVERLSMGPVEFESDAGAVSWIDMPFASTTLAAGTVESYTAQLASNQMLQIYGEANGSGALQRARVVVGTSTAAQLASSNIPDYSLIVGNGILCVDNGSGTCSSAARTQGQIYAKSSSVTAVDLAENYPTKDASLKPGDLVMLDTANPVFVKKYDPTAADSKLIGVVSTNPGLLLGGFSNPQFASQMQVAVSLKGRVPVKVSNENGPINIGDRLAPAILRGFGAKAITNGMTVGMALEPLAGDVTTTGTIDVFIDLGYNFTGNQFFIASNGNVGIGGFDGLTPASTPQYKLTVAGDVGAESFIYLLNASSLQAVTQLTSDDNTEILAKLGNLKVIRMVESPTDLSIVVDESIPEVLSSDKKGFDLFKLISFIVSSIQGLTKQVADLALRVIDLEATASSTQVQTEKLCLDDVCITKDQLQALLASQNLSSSPIGTGSGGQGTDTGTSTASTTPSSTSTPEILIDVGGPANPTVDDTFIDLGDIISDPNATDSTSTSTTP